MNYLELIRLRTLPLSVCVVVVGNALAHHAGFFEAKRFVSTLLTAVLLQIVSNIANDYGDGIRGSDTHRPPNAPKRFAHCPEQRRRVQSALWLAMVATVVSGLFLLYLLPESCRVVFAGLGILSLVAALNYTLGDKPYGYQGFGEVSVLLFFGGVGVVGSYAVQGAPVSFALFLPALGFGLLCVAVLMVNNLRDLTLDAAANKRTLAVILGEARYLALYRLILLSAWVCWLLLAYDVPRTLLMSLMIFPIIQQLRHTQSALQHGTIAQQLPCHIRLMALASFLFVISLL